MNIKYLKSFYENSLPFLIILFLFFLGTPMIVKSFQEEKILIDFSKRSKFGRWMIINDGVMGGVSKSNYRFHPEGYIIFKGYLSTDYGGGFASLRSDYKDWIIDGYKGFIIRVRGDGKKYQFRCRTDNEYYEIAFRHYFKSKKNIWHEIRLPFSHFVPTYRGRIIKGVPALKSKDIRSIGLMISDKQVGYFHLEVGLIGVY